MPKRKGKHKGKGMPANVLAYFKYRNAGMSKEKAKAKAGLGTKKKESS